MFGIRTLRANRDFGKVEADVQWWFSANIKAVVDRATKAKDVAAESKVRLNAANAYYASIKEAKLNQVAATKTAYETMVECQVAEKKLSQTKRQLRQKLLDAGSSAITR